jgi:hypothetical protein
MQQDIAQPSPRYSGFGLLGGWWATLPRESLLGLVMIGLAWAVSWGQVHPLAQFYFFPIWLGYILLVDGVVLARRGTSLIEQGTRQFVALFVISAVFWWIFEAMNIPVQNWRYLGISQYTTLEYTIFATLPFSTVLPAVLETATLIGSFLSPNRYMPLAKVEPPSRRLWLLMALGVAAAIAPWIWPNQMYPFIWSSLILLLEPINWMAGRPSTFRLLRAGDVTLLLTLFVSGITCGFLWEMWNFYSYPKWIYVLPGVTAPKLFEMPLPGYMGYFPFAIELYAMYNLVLLLTGRSSNFERVMQIPRQVHRRAGRHS